MIFRIYRLALFLLVTGVMFLQASVSATPETLDGVIRVGLQSVSGKGKVTAQFNGPVRVVDLNVGQASPELTNPVLEFTLKGGMIECTALNLRSSVGFRISPRPEDTFGVGKRTYRGYLEIAKDDGGLRVINEADLEDYVYGALLLEGGPSMRPESLKALAVAIRTYGVRNRNKHGKGLFDVCDTTHCQGYAGVPSAPAPWAKSAQEGTSGMILTWKDAPIWAAYSTDCGGATANNEDGGFGETPWPYLRATPDTDGVRHDYCALSSSHRWVKEIPIRRMESLLNAKKATRIGRLADISVDRTDAYGRALTLRLKSDTPPKNSGLSGKTAAARPGEGLLRTAASTPSQSPAAPPAPPAKTLRATSLRSLLGESVLKSTFFSVKKQGDVLRFEGRGYGHGVGMCLAGAEGMARAGIGYRDILSRYYNGTTLVQLYETLPENSSAGEE